MEAESPGLSQAAGVGVGDGGCVARLRLFLWVASSRLLEVIIVVPASWVG